MLRPAVLRAEQVVLARLGRREPDRTVAAGDRVRLHAEGGNEQRVQHVLGCEHHLDRAAERYMQLVDLALTIDVLKPPHPALARRVNLERLIRRPHQVEEHDGRPGEDRHRHEKRDDGPAELQRDRTRDRRPRLVRRSRSRYLIAKMMTNTTTSSAKNAVTAVTKKYRLSTSGARLEACSGKSGIPSNIKRYGLTRSGAAPADATRDAASTE